MSTADHLSLKIWWSHLTIGSADNFLLSLLQDIGIAQTGSTNNAYLRNRHVDTWDHVKNSTLLDISPSELCQNPIVLERENFKMLAGDMLLSWSFLVLKRLDFDKVLTVKCQGGYYSLVRWNQSVRWNCTISNKYADQAFMWSSQCTLTFLVVILGFNWTFFNQTWN